MGPNIDASLAATAFLVGAKPPLPISFMSGAVKNNQEAGAVGTGNILLGPHKSFRHTLGLAPSSSPFNKKANSTVSVVGHRGAVFEYLENTREGFLRCARLGVHIELDVFQVEGNTLVVFHGGGTDESPGKLEEYCTGSLPHEQIADCSWEQIQELQFDPAHEEFPCPPEKISQGKIPTLEDVLRDLKEYPATHIKIELKGGGGPEFVQSVVSLVEAHGMQDRCSYSSFHHPYLHHVREFRPYPGTAALFKHPIPRDYLVQAQGCTEIHLPYDACSVERVSEIQQAGFKSMAWFRGPMGMQQDLKHMWGYITEEECYPDLIRAGVDEICCNKPHRLVELLQQQ